NTAMPDRSPIDPVEPFLDPRKHADEDEGDREQQDRLRTQELSGVAPARLSRGSSDEPHEAPKAHEGHDRRGPDLPSDDAPAHAEDPTRWTAGAGTGWRLHPETRAAAARGSRTTNAVSCGRCAA